jgi:Phosphotransferase enzyme family
LRAAGARDLTQEKLESLLRPFFAVAHELMVQQVCIPPAPLSDKELNSLMLVIDRALAVLNSAGIPDCLGHLDPNPGNFLVSGQSCTILDWAEAYIGHPFFSFEYLLRYHCRQFNRSAQNAFRTAYYALWICGFEAKDLALITSVMPVLAAFAYAVGTEAWTSPNIFQDHVRAAQYRSLVRTMSTLAKASLAPTGSVYGEW